MSLSSAHLLPGHKAPPVSSKQIPTEFGKDRDIVGCKVADSWGKSMVSGRDRKESVDMQRAVVGWDMSGQRGHHLAF